MIPQVLLIAGLSLLLPPASPGPDQVRSFQGIVRIPCRYMVHTYPYSMCWGRGPCPSRGCNDGIIWTDGSTVTWRKSDKYHLMGNMEKGDVTLTIIRATGEDSGTYCCRVEIPGLFNDQKIEIDVDKEHVEDDVDINDLRIAPVYVPQEFAPAHPKVTHKKDEKMSEEEPLSLTQPETTVVETMSTKMSEEKPFSSTQPETTVGEPLSTERSPPGETTTSPPEMNMRTDKSSEIAEMTEKIDLSTIIRVTAIFSLTFLPLLIYTCIRVNKKGKA